MSKDEISRLREALARDPELRARLEQAKTVEALIAWASEAGYTFTPEELRQALQAQAKELTEGELQRIAGGAGKTFLIFTCSPRRDYGSP